MSEPSRGCARQRPERRQHGGRDDQQQDRRQTPLHQAVGITPDDADDFQKKGLSWAGDLDALSAVRLGLRKRCEQSPIRSPKLIAAGLEHALRTMWRRWCAGLPAETFEAMPQTFHINE